MAPSQVPKATPPEGDHVLRKVLTIDEFKSQARGAEGAGLADAVTLYKANIVILGDDAGGDPGSGPIVIDVVSSDQSVDRHDDTIKAAGWKLHNFRQNPVSLWAHNSRLLPVARATRTEIVGEQLQQTLEFTPADFKHQFGEGFGHTVGRMFKTGFLNAVSVGFSPKLWQFNEERGGIDFLEQELLEISPVTIPANPNALQDAGKLLKEMGVDLAPVFEWAERCLDGDDGLNLIVPRKSIELTHTLLAKQLGKAERTFVDMTTPAKAAPVVSTTPAVPAKTATPAATTPAVKSITDQAKDAAAATAKIEGDALKSITEAVEVLEALGNVSDKDAAGALCLRLAKATGAKATTDAGDGTADAGDDAAVLRIVDGADSVELTDDQVGQIMKRVADTAKETIADLTGRLN